jgi:hypothetical protein
MMTTGIAIGGVIALLTGVGSAAAGPQREWTSALKGSPRAAKAQMTIDGQRSETTPRAARVVVHSVRLGNGDGALLYVWRPWAGAIALCYANSTDAVVLDGNRATYWIEGQRASVVRYHFAGMWSRVRWQYGVSQATAERALRQNARRSSNRR